MKTIEISEERFEQIRKQALASGYEDVADYLDALVEDAAFDPRGGMTDAQLHQSAAECDAIIDRTKRDGGGKEFGSAWQELGKEFGFKTEQ